ncbi:hypothetical protein YASMINEVIRUS_516 [Yasminevirus sp. GU-2018]|uniref:Uncharacterized protein n=1 Tax=Yasminevirus sp. GU-2018 TaxID=2420051 RepID=A0A5K0U9I3_9VIRU|nr:hypothetical protein YASMINEVIRUS_516 [Yasminevirus sp. GU-2018]
MLTRDLAHGQAEFLARDSAHSRAGLNSYQPNLEFRFNSATKPLLHPQPRTRFAQELIFNGKDLNISLDR